jgi:hypothetical protein
MNVFFPPEIVEVGTLGDHVLEIQQKNLRRQKNVLRTVLKKGHLVINMVISYDLDHEDRSS